MIYYLAHPSATSTLRLRYHAVQSPEYTPPARLEYHETSANAPTARIFDPSIATPDNSSFLQWLHAPLYGPSKDIYPGQMGYRHAEVEWWVDEDERVVRRVKYSVLYDGCAEVLKMFWWLSMAKWVLRKL
jgi:hypothetical protein